MFPVIEAKINAAGHVATEQGVIAKSVVALPTIPVGSPPGMVTRESPGFLTRGLPLTSPRKREAVLVPLSEIQNELVPLRAMPHGLTSSGFWMNATPGRSETKFVCR